MGVRGCFLYPYWFVIYLFFGAHECFGQDVVKNKKKQNYYYF